MSDQTNQEREGIARDLAYEEGRRRERVDGRLDSHEARLNAINGSIHKTGESLDRLGEKVDALAERQRIRDAVDADRLREFKEANEKQISTRAFVLGVLAILVPLMVLILQQQGAFK